MVTIQSNVLMPKEQSKHKMDRSLKGLVERYTDAYYKVYGCHPAISYDNPWIKIEGLSNRITRQRLMEMTRQLEYRLG